jgi:hypothetical protein
MSIPLPSHPPHPLPLLPPMRHPVCTPDPWSHPLLLLLALAAPPPPPPPPPPWMWPARWGPASEPCGMSSSWCGSRPCPPAGARPLHGTSQPQPPLRVAPPRRTPTSCRASSSTLDRGSCACARATTTRCESEALLVLVRQRSVACARQTSLVTASNGVVPRASRWARVGGGGWPGRCPYVRDGRKY